MQLEHDFVEGVPHTRQLRVIIKRVQRGFEIKVAMNIFLVSGDKLQSRAICEDGGLCQRLGVAADSDVQDLGWDLGWNSSRPGFRTFRHSSGTAL